VKLTTHLRLVPLSSIRRAIPPLPNTPSWLGAQLKDRDNFTLTPTVETALFSNLIVMFMGCISIWFTFSFCGMIYRFVLALCFVICVEFIMKQNFSSQMNLSSMF